MNENMRLHAELRAAQEMLAVHRSEARRSLEARCFDERARGMDENAKLLNLHVASLRLHEGKARQEVLTAIHEIVINLIGSEEFAVFEVSPDGAHLHLVSSYGLNAAPFHSIPMGQGVIGQVAASGESHLASDAQPFEAVPTSGIRLRPALGAAATGATSTVATSATSTVATSAASTDARAPEESDLTACVPLRLCGRVVGVLAMFRLLAHKDYLGELDRELLELVSMQAAPALYCAQLMAG
jgi:GAF domain-containing protein